MKPSDIVITVAAYMQERINTILLGGSGVGKSDIITGFFANLKWDSVLMMPAISDPTDFKGMPWVAKDAKSATFLPFGDLLQLLQADKPTVCFMDDFLHASQATQAATMHLLQARQINGHRISDHVRFIAATNRKEDKAAVNNMIDPVKSRYRFLTMEPDRDDWLLWAARNSIRPEVRAFVRWKGEYFYDPEPTKGLENKSCPRTLHALSDVMNCLDMHNVPKRLELECFTGAIGKSFAAEFVAFLRMYRELPNPDTIIIDPRGAKIPQDIGALISLCAALASRATEDNMESICIYADRLTNPKNFKNGTPKTEFVAYLMKDATIRNEEIVNTLAYIDWASRNKAIMGL